ncbi:integrase/recombinase [Rhodococcus wratislaviensis IFP 2016]|nr:integrase/recombinase [Rhodococcus wratislaviensis IFP 2016]
MEASVVAALLGSCDRTRSVGLRDYAVLTLLVRLGLRAGEVAALTLDEVDWRSGELVVRGKGGRVDRLPLPRDVGEALVDYLRNGRPRSSSRALFVRVCAPDGAMSAGSVAMVPRSGWQQPEPPPTGPVPRHRQHTRTATANAERRSAPSSTRCCTVAIR